MKDIPDPRVGSPGIEFNKKTRNRKMKELLYTTAKSKFTNVDGTEIRFRVTIGGTSAETTGTVHEE